MIEPRNQLSTAKLAVYVLICSIVKINPNYFSVDMYKALAKQEKDLIKRLQELDENITINDLLVSIFEKERMH